MRKSLHPLAGIAAGSVLIMSWIIVPALLMWSYQ